MLCEARLQNTICCDFWKLLNNLLRPQYFGYTVPTAAASAPGPHPPVLQSASRFTQCLRRS
ncbi:hypothetical protein PGT21_024214 [Puccinia graminis f. sp. tritici]|uniref:Uncharacterized protein n=1 Tax=Puccinia graminis f. sp. tritici TaxID=56615 RepID=A0A5B0MPI7_PUCGR|nr:hypothetical protein PGT21_024214 [Puccinia graminis f. sp. tritici]